jgi:hypothetical protein
VKVLVWSLPKRRPQGFPLFPQRQLGLIFLLRERFGRPRLDYFTSLLKCLAKIFVVSVCDVFGKGNLIVANRFRPIAPEQQRQAEDGLARVLSCPLPI